MDAKDPENAPSCRVGCARCPAAAGNVPPDAPAGWRLVLPAAVAFFVPALLAMAGLFILPACWPHPYSQAVGGVGGLAGGMLLAGLGSVLLRKVP